MKIKETRTTSGGSKITLLRDELDDKLQVQIEPPHDDNDEDPVVLEFWAPTH